MTGNTPSELTFALDANLSLVLLGVLIACGIGMLRGLLPAIRAGSVSGASAMRSL